METENFGTVTQIEVGAMLVGKIKNHHNNGEFSRGEEKGTFLYGGSTIVLLLEKDSANINPYYFSQTEKEVESPVKMGENLMKDEKIIKAYESLIQTKTGYIWQEVLNLINRLKVENKKYRNKVCTQRQVLKTTYDTITRLQKRIGEQKHTFDESIIDGQLKTIQEQQAEIEELYKSLDKYILEIQSQKAEIERLNFNYEKLHLKYENAENNSKYYKRLYETTKSEAIEEVLKNLKDDILNICLGLGRDVLEYDEIESVIDNIKKEMTE